jgi:hypothetical protein
MARWGQTLEVALSTQPAPTRWNGKTDLQSTAGNCAVLECDLEEGLPSSGRITLTNHPR